MINFYIWWFTTTFRQYKLPSLKQFKVYVLIFCEKVSHTTTKYKDWFFKVLFRKLFLVVADSLKYDYYCLSQKPTHSINKMVSASALKAPAMLANMAIGGSFVTFLLSTLLATVVFDEPGMNTTVADQEIQLVCKLLIEKGDTT